MNTGLENEQGWTYVKPRSRWSRKKSAKPSIEQNSVSENESRIASSRPAAEIDAEYRRIRSQWEQSQCCISLRHLIATHAHEIGTISHGICLGIGSFDPSDGAWEAKRRAFVQFTAFLYMIEELENILSCKIPCFFQEPAFAPSEEQFIQNLGHSVIQSPRATQVVDKNSVVYGIHLYRPIYAQILEQCCPAIFVGTGWDVWDQITISQPVTDLGNMREMERYYKKSPFPQDTTSTAFSSTSIYWRSCSELGCPPSLDGIEQAQHWAKKPGTQRTESS